METLLNNRYRVIRTLGGGGFGETFIAEDTQMPSNRRCVIKLLKPIHNNPEIYKLVQERFQREAAILEDLGSYADQIPTLYAYFQSNEQFYLVQEWVEGETLTVKFRQQGLFSESAVREILVNLLPVLEYVHSKRIIHRDIKPDNIILRHRDGKPVLIDFGAVRESMGTMVNSQGNPTSSIVIGTPGYMPSEQAAGRPVYSSDLYSLGMTAIYLLTGKQPQELETDPRTGEIIWHQHAWSVSPTLAAVIDRAIAYHPRERFATAREMLDALQLGAVNFSPTIPYQSRQPQPPTIPYQHPPVTTVPPAATPPQTVAVSPASFPSAQLVTQNNSNRGILLGSLIAGSLIGASVLIGFALNRPNQPVAQSTPSSTESTTNNITKNIQPLETPPVFNPPVITTNQQTNQNLTPPINPQIRNKLSSPTIPVNSPTPENSPTIAAEPQETTSPDTPETPEVERPSPAKAVEDYYETINQGEYETAWNLLSASFQNNRKLHPKGYASYVDWWGGQVESVSLEETSLVEDNVETATVTTRLTFFMKSGKKSSASVQLTLLWDGENSRWVVHGAKSVSDR